MPTPALLLSIATLLPLASFVLLVFVGKRMGKPLAGWVGTTAIFGSFVCSVLAWALWAGGNPGGTNAPLQWGKDNRPINLTMRWIPVGEGVNQDHPGFMDVGVYVDSLTVIMFCMITFVSFLVHVFSTAYMAEDKRFPRFFTYLSLFCFSMLGLVLGGTILQLFIFWELVGLCSYLLIGFWYEKKSASNAAMKAFIVNRVGDFGFLIGFGILFYHLGNATLPHVWGSLNFANAGANGAITLPGGVAISYTLLTVMGIGLFFGAVGKSAQFPLHVWLPDAMEGPTPVSALIHAATMVAAGVYLVGRIFPILTPDARLFIAIIGCVTLAMAALIAIAQSDIKKVLAYSTLSQLGYMILAMGVGSWVGGLFHLITHAFFKALLFLGSGSVIHAAHHEQEMTQYGGLMRKIPVTGLTFAIAVFAIAGTPGLSGYYSKDMILGGAAAFSILGEGVRAYQLLFWVPAITAYITAFYMTRCWMLTFFGKPRNQHLYDHAHENATLCIPLMLLAFLAIVAGYRWTMIRGMIESSQKEASVLVASFSGQDPKEFNLFSQAWPNELERPLAAAGDNKAKQYTAEPSTGEEPRTHAQELAHKGEVMVRQYVYWGFVVGIGLGFGLYYPGYKFANILMKIPPLRWIHTWLYRRMYFDELYMGIFVAITIGVARLARVIDTFIVDGLVNGAARFVRGLSDLAGLNDKYVVDGSVTGVANAAQSLGAAVRAPQTGRIRVYVTALLTLVALGIATAVIIAFSLKH